MSLFIRHDGFVATITVAAAGNFADLGDALEPLASGSETRAVVLRLTDGGAAEARPEPSLLDWIEAYPLPLIAVLEGWVRGGALDIALRCDIRICASTSSFRLHELGGRRLLLLVGRDRTASLIAAGGVCSAQSALDAGIVSLLVDEGELDGEATRLAATIASRGPIATRFAKEAMRRGLPLALLEGLRIETDLTVLLQSTKDRAEGVAAFLQKRTPIFTGN